LNVSVKDVNAMVLGGHGDTMVPLIRYANINGVPVMEQLEKKYGNTDKAKEVMDAIVQRTKMAGGEVVKLLKTGSAFYSPATAAVVMTEAVLRDQMRLVPVCAYLEGQYGVDGYYLGVPAVLGAKGVDRIVEVDLNEEENTALKTSISAVTGLVADMERLGF
jgi:malate dehydrogenase